MTQPAPNLQGVVRDGRVQMTDEIGQLSEVPSGELSAALARGLRPATPEQVQAADIAKERGTLGQQALTLGEAALSTVTLGGSDWLGAQISPDWKIATRERRAENPNVTLAGEIAGAVLPTLASGGTNLAARGALAAATPMRALGALGGAVESGIAAGARAAGWSGSSLLSRAALRGLQMAGSGALEGSAFEVTRGLVDAVLNDKEYTAETLAANLERGFKWGVIGGAAVGVGSPLVEAAGKKAVDSILQGRTLGQAARDLAENHAVKAVVGDLKNLAGREQQIGRKILQEGIPLDAPGLAKAAVAAKVVSASDEVLAAAKRLDGVAAPLPPTLADDLAKVDLPELKPTPESPLTWEKVVSARNAADDLQRETIDEVLLKSTPKANDALVAAAAQGDQVAVAQLQELGSAREALAKSLENSADWYKLSAVVSKAEEVTDVAGKAMGVVGILKALASGKAAFLVPGLALPAAAMAARKFVRDRGSQWLAKAANAMAKSESRLDDAALAIAQRGRLPKNYGAAAEKLSVGVVGEPDWVGPLVDQASAASSAPVPAPAKAAAQLGTYVERYKQLQEQTRELKDPKKKLEIISAATADIAAEQPELAAAIQQQLMGDADYLLAVAPPGFSPHTMRPGGSGKQPAVAYHDKRVMVDRAQALNDPDEVLEALARGELNLVQWETLRERRPKRYAMMRSRVLEYALDNPDLPFKKRVLIGSAFELPADWSDLHISEIQAINGPAAPEQPAPPTKPLNDSSDMLATPAQKASL